MLILNSFQHLYIFLILYLLVSSNLVHHVFSALSDFPTLFVLGILISPLNWSPSFIKVQILYIEILLNCSMAHLYHDVTKTCNVTRNHVRSKNSLEKVGCSTVGTTVYGTGYFKFCVLWPCMGLTRQFCSHLYALDYFVDQYGLKVLCV